METVLLVIHLMVAIALVALVLLQRSEGGALGIGGGGGGLMTGRGAANALTRMTAYVAAAFFATSIGLTILANQGRQPASSIVDGVAVPSKPTSKPGLPAIAPDLPKIPQVPAVPKSQ